jgi:hypothetical protein
MDGRSELLAYLGTGLATIAVLFGLQSWYASYLDVFVVHADKSDVQLDAKVAAVRAQEAAKLGSLAEAKQALVKRGRAAFAHVAPKSSDDLSAMSGWIHKPAFAAYVPRAQPKPVADVVPDAGVEGTPSGEAAVEGAPVPKPVQTVPQAAAALPKTAKVAKPVRAPAITAAGGSGAAVIAAPHAQAPQPQVQ